MMKASRSTLLGVSVLLVGVAVVAFGVHMTRTDTSTSASAASVPAAATAVVKRDTITNNLTVAGEFLPYQEVELHAKVAGYIRQIYVDIGDRVRRGQVLAMLEVPELTAQVQG